MLGSHELNGWAWCQYPGQGASSGWVPLSHLLALEDLTLPASAPPGLQKLPLLAVLAAVVLVIGRLFCRLLTSQLAIDWRLPGTHCHLAANGSFTNCQTISG